MEQQQYLITKEQFLTVSRAWKTSIRYPSAVEIIIYNVLRSKPIKNGFVMKTRHIQGNSPWYGFESALKKARERCNNVNPFDPTSKAGKIFEEVFKNRKVTFRSRFGIDLPEGIMDRLKEEA